MVIVPTFFMREHLSGRAHDGAVPLSVGAMDHIDPGGREFDTGSGP